MESLGPLNSRAFLKDECHAGVFGVGVGGSEKGEMQVLRDYGLATLSALSAF